MINHGVLSEAELFALVYSGLEIEGVRAVTGKRERGRLVGFYNSVLVIDNPGLAPAPDNAFGKTVDDARMGNYVYVDGAQVINHAEHRCTSQTHIPGDRTVYIYCSRPLGHSGDHVAAKILRSNKELHFLKRWPKTEGKSGLMLSSEKVILFAAIGGKTCGEAGPFDRGSRSAPLCCRVPGHGGDHARCDYGVGGAGITLTHQWVQKQSGTWPEGEKPPTAVMPEHKTVIVKEPAVKVTPAQAADACVRFLAGLQLGDHPVADQRMRDQLVRAYAEATGRDKPAVKR